MLTLKIRNKNFIHFGGTLFFQYFDSTSIINYQNNYYLAVHVRVNALHYLPIYNLLICLPLGDRLDGSIFLSGSRSGVPHSHQGSTGPYWSRQPFIYFLCSLSTIRNWIYALLLTFPRSIYNIVRLFWEVEITLKYPRLSGNTEIQGCFVGINSVETWDPYN